MTNIPVNTTGSFTLLNGTTLGSDYTNRIGRKIVCKSMYIRGFVTAENSLNLSAAATPSQQARMILLVDMQPNGAAPAVTDVLNTAHPASQLNLNNRDRFKVLRDDVFTLDPISVAAGSVGFCGTTTYEVSCYKKMSLETIYNSGSAGTIGDINSGALYMFWIGSAVTGTNTDGAAVVSARLRFLDP